MAATVDAVTRAVMLYMDRPHEAGKADCWISPCLSFDAIWSVSIARHLPEYNSAGDAMRRIDEAGGALALCDAFADRAGLVQREKHLGALGQFSRGFLPVCFAVCVGKHWATKKEDVGFSLMSGEPQRIWGI